MIETSSSAAWNEWASEIEQHGVIILPRDSDALLVDSLRPWVAVAGKHGDPTALARMTAVRKAASTAPRQRSELVYAGHWPPPGPAIQSLLRLATQFGPKSTVLRVYFPDNADLVSGLNALAGTEVRCRVQFRGQLPELTEAAVIELIRRGASVVQTTGWPVTKAPDLDRIAAVSALGLRVPVMIYVHRNNIDHALDIAEALLRATDHSGVGFEPACVHPHFTGSDVDLIPKPAAYHRLLVTAYQRFCHHDDVFEPIASLVQNLKTGGWDPALDTGLPVRYQVYEDGSSGQFRQFPWATAVAPAGAGQTCVTMASVCSRCKWRKSCGGCEPVEDDLFQTVCGYRLLFLEFFTREMHDALMPLEEV